MEKKYAVRPALSKQSDNNLNKYPDLLRKLLFYRGIEKIEDAERFMNPDYDLHVHDPYLLKDMEKVVARILKAIEAKEKIIIYSDYDADGVPGAVILHDFFRKIDYLYFENYIPHRHEEGFGLHKAAVEEFATQGVKLLITIDCGIADIEAVKTAQELGIDVVITDHHVPHAEVPSAYAILNPKQEGCAYPEKMLCGSGVIFKLVQALLKKHADSNIFPVEIKKGWEKWLLDMVGIATLSDMVPLVGENRVFAYYGLKVLRMSPRVGFMKLLRAAKTNQAHLTEEDVGFTISPRINAASRMGVPLDAFKLLSTRDDVEADRLVAHLNAINDERKGIVAAMTKEVRKIIRDRGEKEAMKKVLVIGNPNWKPALLGLVANALKDDHARPVFLWGRDDKATLKGSCRSDGMVNVLEVMEGAKESFIAFGGHKMSGGFSVSHEKIHTLESDLVRSYEKIVTESSGGPETTWIDETLSLDEANWKTYSLVEKLTPYGTGNPKPLFMFSGVEIQEVKKFGKEKNHLELNFQNSAGKKITAISFFVGDTLDATLKVGGKINLVATMEKSMFRNFPELRLRIVDIIF